MNNGFYPKSNVDRLYLSRGEDDRGLTGVQDTAETVILRLRNYVRNSKERLLIATRTIEDNEYRKHQMSTKRGKRMKGKHSGHKTITWTKAKVIPLVIGVLGTTPIKLRNSLQEIGIETHVTELQKTALLHTALFLRKVLEV